MNSAGFATAEAGRAKNAKETKARSVPALIGWNLLIGIYLSFISKKTLTNKTASGDHYAMNLNETAPGTDDRLNRIQKISRYLRLALQYGIPLFVLLGLTQGMLAEYGIKMPSLPKSTWSAPVLTGSDMHVVYPLYSSLLLLVFLFWYRTVVRLFGCFERGVLFTAETVRFIQILGGIYFARFFLELIFQFLVLNPVLIKSRLSDLFTGFFTFFIGWLIDEARKIREEQELTV